MERRIEMHGYENVENTQLRRLKSNIFDFGVVTAFVTLILFIINFFSSKSMILFNAKKILYCFILYSISISDRLYVP